MLLKYRLKNFANELANKYTIYFDVYRDEKIGDLPLAFIALFKRRDERYMITKKIKVYGVENQQVVFASVCEGQIPENFVRLYKDTILQNMKSFIPEDSEHMSTIVIGFIITDEQPVVYR